MPSERDFTLDRLGRRGRVVVIAPHPDDEVFAVGGIMTLLARAGYELEVVAVTDGEASHAFSSRITPARLREVRARETRNAYRELGIDPLRIRLEIPDSAVQAQSETLRQALATRLAGASIVFAPLETDGHPDHDAVGLATREVTAALDATLWRFAIWARVHPERITQGAPSCLPLPPDVVSRKRRAAAQYRSQLTALGPDAEDGPVLPRGFLAHFIQDKEPLWQTP